MSTEFNDVFVSYQSDDLELAEDLHRRLLAEGFRVWFDKARLSPGCSWHDEIEAGCEASRVLLPVLTPSWKTSEWTRFETYGAEAIVPLLYRGNWEDVAPPPLRRYQNHSIDLRQLEEASWPQLFEVLHSLLTRPAPQRTERVAHMRYRTNPHFVGREVEINRIHEALHHAPDTSLTQGSVQAITALGGVGKTTLARQYAEKFWRSYSQIFWIDAHMNLEGQFARLADILEPDHLLTEESEKAKLALRLLNQRTERLLVLDDAEDEESIQEWIPKAGGCHVLITSRFAGWSAAVPTSVIYVLEPEPSRELLLARAGHEATPANEAACDRLAEQLGYLPLALEQAAAYVAEQGSEYSFEDYILLYKKSQAKLLAKGILGSSQYPRSVITTWKATTEKLSPSARSLLHVSSFLASDPIPIDVFVAAASIIRNTESLFSFTTLFRKLKQTLLRSAANAQSDDEMYIRDAVEFLTRYSMAVNHGRHFQIHPLVQVVEQAGMGERARRPGLMAALQTLLVSLPRKRGLRYWVVRDELEPHFLAICNDPQVDWVEASLQRLLDHLGISLREFTRSSKPRPGANNFRFSESHDGPNTEDVSDPLKDLAALLQEEPTTEIILEHLKDAVRTGEQILKHSHPEIAVHLGKVAVAFNDSSRYPEAVRLARRTILIAHDSDGSQQPPSIVVWINALSDLFE